MQVFRANWNEAQKAELFVMYEEQRAKAQVDKIKIVKEDSESSTGADGQDAESSTASNLYVLWQYLQHSGACLWTSKVGALHLLRRRMPMTEGSLRIAGLREILIVSGCIT